MSLNDEDRVRIASQLVESLPFSRALNMRLDRIEVGIAELSMPWSADLVGDPDTQVIHGGAVSALMDTCGGAVVMSVLPAGGTTATLDLRIDYMRSARPGQRITARAECHHVTRSVAFVRARAWDDDIDRPVATATGAFTAISEAGA
ncbi:MAG: PaaI family thioesterase [Pseudomonadota bacterium]